MRHTRYPTVTIVCCVLLSEGILSLVLTAELHTALLLTIVLFPIIGLLTFLKNKDGNNVQKIIIDVPIVEWHLYCFPNGSGPMVSLSRYVRLDGKKKVNMSRQTVRLRMVLFILTLLLT